MRVHNTGSFRRIAGMLAAALLVACGGGGGDGGGGSNTGGDDDDDIPPVPPPPVTLSGVFLDSAVEGLTYQSGSNLPGTTDVNGTFTYTVGELLTFSIGGVELGTLPDGSPMITPFDFGGAAAANIARFLQTLDADGDPSNGIDLTEAASALADMEIGDAVFLSDPTTFETEIASVLETALGPAVALIDEATALAHLVAATSSEFTPFELANHGFVAVFPSENEIGVMSFDGSTVDTMWRNDTIELGGDGTTTTEDWIVDENGLLVITNSIEQSTVTIEKVGRSSRAISIIATESPGADPIIGTLLVPVAATRGSLAGAAGRTFIFADDGGATEATFLPDGTVTSLDDGNLSEQPWKIDENEVLVSVLDNVVPEINLIVLMNGSFSLGGDVLHIGATNLSGNPEAPILQLDNTSEGTLTPVIPTNSDGTISYVFAAGGEAGIIPGQGATEELVDLLSGLTVTGTFDYDNSAALSDVIGGGILEGASAYESAVRNLEGSVGTMRFSVPETSVVVSNDLFNSGGSEQELVDLLLISTEVEAGFTIGEFTLINIHLGWGEGLIGDGPDFVNKQDLPAALPAFDSSVQLDFTSPDNPDEVVFVFFPGLTASPALQ